MDVHSPVIDYSIRDIIDYRAISWEQSEEFFFLTQIPVIFEPFLVNPTYYCFGIITQGSLDIQIDHHNYELSPTSLMTYRPGQVFKVKNVSEDTRGCFVLFTKKFLDYLNENIFSVKSRSFLSSGMQTVVELSTADRDRIINIFQEIFGLLHHLSKPNWELIARNLTSALVLETNNILIDYLTPKFAVLNKDNDLFNRFKELIMINFKHNRNLSFYASELCVTLNYLNTIIKKTSGKNPSFFINQRIIQESKFLICQSTENFSEIAYSLNFSDPFTFSKYFKKHTNLSPSQFRKQANPGIIH